MTTYKEIFGKPIKVLSSDPANETEGQVWYNSTSGTFKTSLATAAWSAGSPLSTGRRGARNIGTQASSLFVAGNLVGPPGTTLTVIVEEYNGSGWSSSPSVSNAVYGFSNAGTSTAGLKAGGFYPPINNTEEYNGSSWTAGGALNQARGTVSGAGTQTAGLAFGGRGTPDTTYRANAEEYNGSAWANVNAMPTASGDNIGGGIQTSAISAGGENPTLLSNVFEYDGTNWTTGTSLPAGNSDAAGSGSSSTDFLVFGGTLSPNTTSLKYDGSAWTATASLATGRRSLAGSGSPSSASIAAGGAPVTNNGTNTEEYNLSTSTVIGAAFSSGGNMPDATSKVADGGTQTAAVQGGGQKNNPDSSPTSSSEYNGTSWTAGNALPASYGSVTGATGTQTALITGGGGSPSTVTFEYDGTNWTAGGSLGTGRYNGKCLGTQTAAAYCGGRVSPPSLNNVEEYNGSSWTAVTAMPIAIRSGGGIGTQTAGVVVSGFQGPSSPPVSPTSSVSRGVLGFDYDGSSWTAGASALIAGADGGAAGIQTVAIYLAGENPALSPGSITTSQTYDGTSYTTNASVIRSRATAFGITSSRTAAVGTAAMIFGGADPAATPNDTAATEEYNAGTTTVNPARNITTS